MKFKMKTFVKWIIKNWEILKHKKIYKINLDCIEKKNKKKNLKPSQYYTWKRQ